MVLLLFRDAFSLKRIFGAREPAAQERAAPAEASAPVPAGPAAPRDEAP
jgi:hypothetical protein